MEAGSPVLLVPGLMASDWTMWRLSQMLRRAGHPTIPARIGFNIGCTTELVERLEERLEAASLRYGRPAVVIGWSRGGCLGKIVAIRRPELVSALLTLGSPNVDPLAVSRVVTMQIKLLTRLNAYGVRQMLGTDCLSGDCADTMRTLLMSRFPKHVPYVSFYSKSDGVVDWRACCDPDAELVEVRASHFQLGVDPRILRMVLRRLEKIEHRPATAA